MHEKLAYDSVPDVRTSHGNGRMLLTREKTRYTTYLHRNCSQHNYITIRSILSLYQFILNRLING